MRDKFLKEQLEKANEDIKKEIAQEVKLDHTAYTVFRDPVTSKWVYGTISFNPNGKLGELTKLEQEDLGVAIERFKIEVARNLFNVDR